MDQNTDTGDDRRGDPMTDLEPTEYAGYQAHAIAPTTGTLVILVEAEKQAIPASDGGRWALICEGRPDGETHASVLQDTNRRRLAASMRHPEEWCETCQEEHQP